MDNKSIYFTQKKFDEVWGRVTGNEPSDSDTLKIMMEYEYTDWYIYSTLAKKHTGELRTRFLEMAKDEQRHFRMLNARYYMLTGHKHTAKKPENLVYSSVSELLLIRYKTEREASSGYLRAADETRTADICALYRANAADEEKHARILLYLLGNAI